MTFRKLTNSLPLFFQRVIIGDIGPKDWDHLADIFDEAARLARKEGTSVIVIDQRS